MSDSECDFSSFGLEARIPPWFEVTKKDRNGRANRALRVGGPAWQLFEALRLGSYPPCFYSLRYHNLFLDRRWSAKELIYDRKTISVWKRAIRKYIKPPYFFCLEVGMEGEIHAHVVAGHWAGLTKYQRGYDKGTVRIIKDSDADRHRVISYMYKTPVPLTEDHDDIKAPKLQDWRQRLNDHSQALIKLQAEGRIRPYQLSDYV